MKLLRHVWNYNNARVAVTAAVTLSVWGSFFLYEVIDRFLGAKYAIAYGVISATVAFVTGCRFVYMWGEGKL